MLQAGQMKRINWLHTSLLLGFHIYAGLQMMSVPLKAPTFIWMFVYAIITGICHTAGLWSNIAEAKIWIILGYHRLWSHRSYDAHPILRLFLAIVGAGAFRQSIRWFALHHRAHHRYSDTSRDPSNPTRGFFFAHIGWMMVQDEEDYADIDISDVESDSIVMWQEKHIVLLSVLAGICFPVLVAGLGWGDWKGGLVYAALVRVIVVWHSSFSVNSLAHNFGERPYSKRGTARNNHIVAIITLGEGYHNFHHRHPSDYRNGIQWYDCDPTKWVIFVCSQVGLASGLKRIKH
ncbi:hypothetical protein N7540_009282 [Penicillium herquei]|nr:hypothetical protein N7540_009282 [Penicillium herquei]